MKYLILLAVLGLAFWWLRRRGRDKPPVVPPPRPPARGGDAAPASMVACAHCGVHLPQAEALLDAGGRPYCSEAHRAAGPR